MSIEHGRSPSPEDLGLDSYKAPEQYGPESPEVPKDYIEAGTRQIRRGDKVYVEMPSGTIENDWVLQSFGKTKAVVEKPEPQGKGTLRKVVEMDTFINWQIAYEGTEENPPQPWPEGFAREVKGEELKAVAGRMGIDTTQEGWQKECEKRIRDNIGI